MGVYIEWYKGVSQSGSKNSRKRRVEVVEPKPAGIKVVMNIAGRQEYCEKEGIPFDLATNQTESQPTQLPPEEDAGLPNQIV